MYCNKHVLEGRVHTIEKLGHRIALPAEDASFPPVFTSELFILGKAASVFPMSRRKTAIVFHG